MILFLTHIGLTVFLSFKVEQLLNNKKQRQSLMTYCPYQFQTGNSPLHKANAGWKLIAVMILSGLSVAAKQPWAIAMLLCLNICLYKIAGFGLTVLWLDLRFFLLQIPVIVLLFVLRYNMNGLSEGLKVGLQIMLLFMPGAIFIRTTRSSQIMQSLKRIMPRGISFIIFTSLRFVPVFAREIGEIAIVQRLRGAPLSPRKLLNPLNWKDIFHCLIIPLLIRAIKTADEAALSAEARGFRISGVQTGNTVVYEEKEGRPASAYVAENRHKP
jgi:energy-coupling factor transport system permease protein